MLFIRGTVDIDIVIAFRGSADGPFTAFVLTEPLIRTRERTRSSEFSASSARFSASPKAV